MTGSGVSKLVLLSCVVSVVTGCAALTVNGGKGGTGATSSPGPARPSAPNAGNGTPSSPTDPSSPTSPTNPSSPTGPSSPTAPSPVPLNAIAVDGIQDLPGWRALADPNGGPGSASGTTELVGAPSLSGSAREFATSYSNYGDERYNVVFGEDTAATNFFYDGWVYLASPSSDIANLEMDLNQVMVNGQTVIFGFQCDGYSGTWDYTENAGTPEAPVDHWMHTAAPCNPRSWQADTWHHVQISFSRDDAGNVTYSSVWLDGTEQAVNISAPSAFALGWGPSLLTNFQVDGLGSGGSSTAYLDNLVIYRW